MTFRNPGVGSVAVDRQKLYEQVWTIPGAKLALQYGISDVGLAKACRRHNIPRPPRGYWARLAAGQKVKEAPLPQSKNPDLDLVVMQGWDLPDETVQRFVADATPTKAMPTSSAVEAQALHPLVEVTRAQLLLAKPDAEGLVRTDAAMLPDVRIAPASLDHCMTVLDRFVRAWEDKGGEIKVGVSGTWTNAAIASDGFNIRVFEILDDSKAITDPLRLTGKLQIDIAGDEQQQFRRRWRETKTQRLERMINPLVETLVNAIAVKRQRRLDEECVARQESRVRAHRKTLAAEHDRDFYWRQHLMTNVDRWHTAQRIRDYLDALRANLQAGKIKPIDTVHHEEWLKWATAYADSIDSTLHCPLPDDPVEEPQNKPAAGLDLTSACRGVVEGLEVLDSDALWTKSEEEVRKHCTGRFGPTWNEITRVLEGLGYDVSKRCEASHWW